MSDNKYQSISVPTSRYNGDHVAARIVAEYLVRKMREGVAVAELRKHLTQEPIPLLAQALDAIDADLANDSTHTTIQSVSHAPEPATPSINNLLTPTNREVQISRSVEHHLLNSVFNQGRFPQAAPGQALRSADPAAQLLSDEIEAVRGRLRESFYHSHSSSARHQVQANNVHGLNRVGNRDTWIVAEYVAHLIQSGADKQQLRARLAEDPEAVLGEARHARQANVTEELS